MLRQTPTTWEVRSRTETPLARSVDVDSYLLTPGKTYTLYALKDEDSSVETVHSFTTDVFVQDSIPLTDGYFNDPAMGGEYSYDMSDEILVLPISLFEAGTVTYELISPSSQLTDMRIPFTAESQILLL